MAQNLLIDDDEYFHDLPVEPTKWKDSQPMGAVFESGLSCPGWREAIERECDCTPDSPADAGVLVLELVGISIPDMPVTIRIESVRCANCEKVLATH